MKVPKDMRNNKSPKLALLDSGTEISVIKFFLLDRKQADQREETYTVC